MPTVVFLGAGSVVFTRQLLADLFRFDDLPELRVVLHDIDAERLAVARGTADQVAQRFGRHAEIVATLDRREALDGADFVVNMIQVGGIDATRVDLLVPAEAGLRQTIGDTTGIGGVFRGLRTFPVLSGIAADMLELCPDALFLNYTNPMAMNVWWLSVVAPQLKVVGLCHSVYWTVHGLCAQVGVPMEGTHFRAGGVNHQAWLTEWSRDGVDLYPRLREVIAADPELERRVRVEIFSRVGVLPDRDQRALLGVPVVVPALRRAGPALPARAAGVPRDLRAERRRVRERPRGAGRGPAARAGGGRGRVRAAGHPLGPHRHRPRDPRERGQPRRAPR